MTLQIVTDVIKTVLYSNFIYTANLITVTPDMSLRLIHFLGALTGKPPVLRPPPDLEWTLHLHLWISMPTSDAANVVQCPHSVSSMGRCCICWRVDVWNAGTTTRIVLPVMEF